MIAVGIDIGKNKHAAAVVDELGRTVSRPEFYANNREGAVKLLEDLAKVAPPEASRVGMEATGNYWLAFRDFLAGAGYQVDVINPIVTSASIAGDVRGRKSDKGDAVAIARVVLAGGLPPRRGADAQSRRLMSLTRHRSFLVAQRADMKKHLQGMLDVVFPEFHTLFGDGLTAFALHLLRAYPTARTLSRAHRTAVAKVVKAHTRGRDALAEAGRLVAVAKESLGVDSEVQDVVGECVVSAVKSILDMDGRIEEMEDRIRAFDEPELAKIISKIKGSGKLLPKVIAAEYGDVSRFETDPRTGKGRGMAKRMLAFAGAEPRIRESGAWKGSVHMSKRGSGALRTALMQAAFTISQNDDYFKSVYDRQIGAGKHHNVALSHVVEKLLEVVCSLWRSGRTYTVQAPGRRVVDNQVRESKKDENSPLLKP